MEYLITVDEHRKLDLLLSRLLGKAGATSASATLAQKSEEKAKVVEKEPDVSVAPEQKEPAAAVLRNPDFLPSISRRSTRIFATVALLDHLIETLLPTLLRRQSFRDALAKLRSSAPLRLALFISSFSAVYRYLHAVFAAVLPPFILQQLPSRRLPPLSRARSLSPEALSSDPPESESSGTLSSIRPHFRRSLLRALLSPSVPPFLAGVCAAPTILLATSGQGRVAIALYAFLRSLQYGYGALRDQEWWPDALKSTRWFWGSHIIFALANAQLLHAAVFHPTCTPERYASVLLRFSDPYLPSRPSYLSQNAPWPSDKHIIQAVGKATALKYPTFSSPLLHSSEPAVRPEFQVVKPVLDHLAHPLHSSVMCALIHPSNPTCSDMAKAALKMNAEKFLKLFSGLGALLLLLRRGQLRSNFEGTLTNTFRVVLGGTTFATLFTTLPWATACFLQSYLPASILSTRRFFVQGFLAGFPIMALPSNAVPEIMFMLSRMSADSWWKVAVKQKRVKSRRGGEAIYFAFAAGLLAALHQHNKGQYLKSKLMRRGLDVVMG